MMSGELDRNKAYNYACDYVEKVLEENPSVEEILNTEQAVYEFIESRW